MHDSIISTMFISSNLPVIDLSSIDVRFIITHDGILGIFYILWWYRYAVIHTTTISHRSFIIIIIFGEIGIIYINPFLAFFYGGCFMDLLRSDMIIWQFVNKILMQFHHQIHSEYLNPSL